ncbi:HNH endonuclease signature motif containing protein [Bacillus thuringiensis]|uniref:HNH endonuclease signature motif containing protein n=1 Tax=Bacillus thuringiensis TaxID=1428 RepID=UPI00211D6FD6|nr:HNH endonuclease signature motif containing protein [Bacillus thuringiensis]
MHHIKEVRERGDLVYELSNLEALCIQCHNAKHGKEKKIRKRAYKIQDVERW